LAGQSCVTAGLPAGAYTVVVTNNAGIQATAAHQLTISPSGTLSPTSGSPGATVTLTGNGFAAGSAVSATFDGSPLALSGTTSTNVNGTFSGASFQVPAGATAGGHTVHITDSAGNAIDQTFTVT
jgi:hypothetical protein